MPICHDVAKEYTDALHKENVHTMISVWGLLDPALETYKRLLTQSNTADVPDAHVYDASSPEARDIYWGSRLPGKLLASKGWDAFWLDGAEPEGYWPHMGDGILRNKQVVDRQRRRIHQRIPAAAHDGSPGSLEGREPEQKRVFLLTRSAFLGQQRVGATVWSGDVYGTYWGLSHQVQAGLNFALSGNPYWTTDIGGYWPPHDDPLADLCLPGALPARWFEFGTFCPDLPCPRPPPGMNEIWSYDTGRADPRPVRQAYAIG